MMIVNNALQVQCVLVVSLPVSPTMLPIAVFHDAIVSFLLRTYIPFPAPLTDSKLTSLVTEISDRTIKGNWLT